MDSSDSQHNRYAIKQFMMCGCDLFGWQQGFSCYIWKILKNKLPSTLDWMDYKWVKL
jgi:hypothetical protein